MEVSPLKLIRNLTRTREILGVLLNHGFGDLLHRMGLHHLWYRWRRLLRWQPEGVPTELTTVERIRLALEALGPTFIKFGQVMSTRPDLIPAEMLEELKRLQEAVPPFPSALAQQVVVEELGQPLHQLFAEFDPHPVAAGSLAQVHRARHHDGTSLAVKIRRPNAVRDTERDISLMLELAALAERHLPEFRVFDPVGLVQHFARTIRRELNFRREARSMQEFARLFRGDPTLHVPRVYHELTTEAVLTMEYIEGLRIDELGPDTTQDFTPADVAARGARLFMRMAFEFGIFHGDPHPGNIRIRHDGTICLLDYGMIGILDHELKEHLIDLFAAVAHQDVERAVRLVLEIGEPCRDVDQDLLLIDMRDFVGNYYGVELEHLRIDQMLNDFVSILSQHGIRCPASIALLIRALVTLEGIGRGLDPHFNLAIHLQPYVETLIKQRYQPEQILHRLWERFIDWGHACDQFPELTLHTFRKLSQGELIIRTELRGLQDFGLELERASNRLVVGMILAALILASSLILRQSHQPTWITLLIYVASSLLSAWLIYGIFRSGRL